MIPRLTLAAVACGALGLAACTPYTMGQAPIGQAPIGQAPIDQGTSRTQQGMLAGAALGGIAGAVSGSGRSTDNQILRTALGAGAGAAIGGLIGQQLDAQAAELRRDMGQDIQVQNTGRELIVTMPQDLLFDIDSANLRPDLQQDLRILASSLNRYPDSTIRVVGHTDNTGSAAHNQRLSERRAASVTGVLRNSGVDGRRLVATGAGLTQPIASNATAEGRRQNRRVDIFIIPNEI